LPKIAYEGAPEHRQVDPGQGLAAQDVGSAGLSRKNWAIGIGTRLRNRWHSFCSRWEIVELSESFAKAGAGYGAALGKSPPRYLDRQLRVKLLENISRGASRLREEISTVLHNPHWNDGGDARLAGFDAR
jgi:hypothetical protein